VRGGAPGTPEGPEAAESSASGQAARSDTGAPAGPASDSPPRPGLRRRIGAFIRRHERKSLFAAGALVAALFMLAHWALTPAPTSLTQDDIDAAVLRTLETKPLPSQAAKAYEAIRPSVVAVRGFGPDPTLKKGKKPKDPKEPAKEGEDDGLVEYSIGTGVVIVDKGLILTNLHVVVGATKVRITFADGLEAEAKMVGARPEHDLAVLQAMTVPDDLVAATMRSTRDLALGHEVLAVGYPFGIGPSVSAGVVSGLKREYNSPEGKRLLTNLIQFDAAANPGNSGGPLVTMDGHVVGIVTGILNPTQQRVFVGIGFAVPIENAAAAVGMPPF